MTLTRLIPVLVLITILNGRGQILVGPVVGGQLNMFSFDDRSNKDLYRVSPTVGYHVGGSVSFRIHKSFFLHTAVLYSERKKVMEGKLDPLFDHEVKYQFIDVPILYTKETKVRFGKDKYYKWYLGFGPNVSYWLGGKGVLKNRDLNENAINPPDYILPYHITFYKNSEEIALGEMNVEIPNRFQLGLNFSAGLIFEPVELNKFMITAKYQLGHTFMSEKSKGDFGLPGKLYYEDDLRIRNHALSLSLYYFIDLKTEERKKGKSTIKSKQKNNP